MFLQNQTVGAVLVLSTAMFPTALMAEQCQFSYLLDPTVPEYYPIGARNGVIENKIDAERALRLYYDTQSGAENLFALSEEYDPDSKRLTINLRQDCGWSDGTPITADHMIAGFENAFSQHIDRRYFFRDLFVNSEEIISGEMPASSIGVEKVDEYTISFEITKPLDVAKAILSSTLFSPKPIHITSSEPEYWSEHTLLRVSSGPFTAISENEDSVVFEENPYYCAGLKSPVDQITIHFAERFSDALPLIIEDKIDALNLHQTWRAGRNLSALGKEDEFNIVELEGSSIDYLFLNAHQGPLADIELRDALLSVIDRDELAREEYANVSGNKPDQLTYFLKEGGHIPENEDMQIAIAEATRVLEEKGFNNQNPLQLRMLSRQSHRRINTFSFLIRSMLAQLPVEVEMEVIETTPDYYKIVNSEDALNYDLYTFIWFHDWAEASNYLDRLSRQEFAISVGAQRDVLDVLGKAQSTIDTEHRQELLNQAADILVDDRSVWPLFSQNSVFVVRDGFELHPELLYLTGASVIAAPGCSDDQS